MGGVKSFDLPSQVQRQGCDLCHPGGSEWKSARGQRLHKTAEQKAVSPPLLRGGEHPGHLDAAPGSSEQVLSGGLGLSERTPGEGPMKTGC